MSYDLMVFDASSAPRERKAFMAWYDQQTQWNETHGYNNPDVPTAPLRAWFQELIKTFPPMNGPLASDDVDDPKVTDYSVGQVVIYGEFTWYQMESLLLSGRLELDEIITHELPLEQFAKGFGLMQSGEGIKVVLDVG